MSTTLYPLEQRGVSRRRSSEAMLTSSDTLTRNTVVRSRIRALVRARERASTERVRERASAVP